MPERERVDGQRDVRRMCGRNMMISSRTMLQIGRVPRKRQILLYIII